MNRFFITTPIYYVNAKPHLGHAYTTTVADALARFHALCGEEVFFLTGTDEHGDKIAEAAAKAGQTPKEYADGISGLFSELWPALGITPTRFIRTTDADHVAAVKRALQLVYDKGDIYFGLWYPIVFAIMTFVIGMIFIPETKDRDIYADDVRS